MSKLINLRNKQFDGWLVLDRDPIKKSSKTRSFYWECKCECGTVKYVDGGHLRNGASTCCGCRGNAKTGQRNRDNKYGFIHGLYKHPLKSIWKAMKHRCYHPNNKHYATYGKKGVIVCEEWKNSFLVFYEWAKKNGWVKGLSIDRIDNDGIYSPQNCEWITRSENSKKNCVLGHYDRKRKKNINTT